MSNNEYSMRPWHLPEYTHPTNWATNQMCRTIKRRDPTRPGFWFLSYRHPHPPLAPLQTYLDLYRDIEIDSPYMGEWAIDAAALPFSLQAKRNVDDKLNAIQMRMARLAFYALCTHIDHQLRVVIGTLREEALLDNTIILFTSDHGDMLGNHGLWAKRLFYENSANIPLILAGVSGDQRVGHHRVDDRLVGWRDIMPTLLDLAGIPIPDTVEGISMVGEETRAWCYCEIDEGVHATRMIRDERYKLIYYATGNVCQLFDLQEDPQELVNLAGDAAHAEVLAQLTGHLISQLYNEDTEWVQNGELVGLPARDFTPGPNKGLTSQRGAHWPQPPATNMPQIEWHGDAGGNR